MVVLEVVVVLEDWEDEEEELLLLDCSEDESVEKYLSGENTRSERICATLSRSACCTRSIPATSSHHESFSAPSSRGEGRARGIFTICMSCGRD